MRGEQLGRRTKIDVGLVGTVAQTLEALVPLPEPKSDTRHLKDAQKHYRKTREKLDDLATPSRYGAKIHPQYLARTLAELATDDAVFLTDVGSPVIWAARYLSLNGKRRRLGSFSHGSMANSIPQAIGVQASHPDRQVVTLSGDGGLAMLMDDLRTLVQSKLPIKIVVFNNSSLNFVELEMKSAGFVSFATDLENPNFAGVAAALGIRGFRVEDPKNLPKGIA